MMVVVDYLGMLTGLVWADAVVDSTVHEMDVAPAGV